MDSLITVSDNAVNARDLYNFLEIQHRFRDWISNSIRDYGFTEGKDFSYFYSESTGGRPAKQYAISITMAKELSMVAKTDKGKNAREYFISCELAAKAAHESFISSRAIGKYTRKTLTDAIKESDENERMHGHAYSTYTRMAYKLTGLSSLKKEWGKAPGFRESLSSDDLQRVEAVEAMSKTMVQMGKQYDDIKKTLAPLFSTADKIEGR